MIIQVEEGMHRHRCEKGRVGGSNHRVIDMIHLKSVMASAIVGLVTTLKHAVLMKAIAFNKFQHNNY